MIVLVVQKTIELFQGHAGFRRLDQIALLLLIEIPTDRVVQSARGNFLNFFPGQPGFRAGVSELLTGGPGLELGVPQAGDRWRRLFGGRAEFDGVQLGGNVLHQLLVVLEGHGGVLVPLHDFHAGLDLLVGVVQFFLGESLSLDRRVGGGIVCAGVEFLDDLPGKPGLRRIDSVRFRGFHGRADVLAVGKQHGVVLLRNC
mmetsp:Transcript_27992/g.61672  ORF Transcript_27992/g.61672 Transcript_27992/m.61672 type:complete len:200 (-) Transcript_27992:268-867(-)